MESADRPTIIDALADPWGCRPLNSLRRCSWARSLVLLERFPSNCMGFTSVFLGREALLMHMRRTSE